MNLSVTASRELAAAVALYDRAPTEVRRAVNAANRSAVSWVRPIVTAQARTPLDRAMTSTVRISAGQNLRIVMGSSGTMRGGIPKRDLVRPVEFGSRRETRTTYTSRSPKGRLYRVTRRTQRQLPDYVTRGRLMYAALPRIAPRLLSGHIRNVLTAIGE